jgi:uncharacterized membrane protein YdbT with pleckstrin-like domain
LQPERVLRSNSTKSLLKATFALAVLTPFLELSYAHIPNYLIFAGFYYLFVGFYMYFKEATEYKIDDAGIHIKRFRRNEVTITYDNVMGLSTAQGILAKRFKVGTVYVELKKGKGGHRSMAGFPIIALKDLPNPLQLEQEIADRTGPLGGVAPPSPQTVST